MRNKMSNRMSEYIPDRMTDGGPYGDRADGCGRLRTVGDGWATSSEHSETGTLATHSGKLNDICSGMLCDTYSGILSSGIPSVIYSDS